MLHAALPATEAIAVILFSTMSYSDANEFRSFSGAAGSCNMRDGCRVLHGFGWLPIRRGTAESLMASAVAPGIQLRHGFCFVSSEPSFSEGSMDAFFWILFLLGAFGFGALFAFVAGCEKV
jgi:hypothetical protein